MYEGMIDGVVIQNIVLILPPQGSSAGGPHAADQFRSHSRHLWPTGE